MDEVYCCVRFQEIAPCALTIVRFTRYEQHTQVLANAVDCGDRTIVGIRHFAGKGWSDNLNNVDACARQFDGDRGLLTDLCLLFTNGFSVDANFHRSRASKALAFIDDGERHFHGLAADAIARSFVEANAAVKFVRFARNQRMNGCIEAKGIFVGRNVVHLTIGDHDCASHA